MPSVLAALSVTFLTTSLVFQFLNKLRISCWLQLVFPTILSLAALLSLGHGAAPLGASGFQPNQFMGIFCIGLLALSVLAILRPGWRWLYWMAWVPNAFACASLIYLVFFWDVFS